jgi:cell division protein FtsI (penicillin-binding protein 3)
MTEWKRQESVQPAVKPPERMNLAARMLAVKVLLLVLFAVVGLRLVQIQVLEAGKYQEMARRQHEATVTLPAMRGRILDRNGNLLVSNRMMVSFAADPKELEKKKGAVADRFARIFGKPREHYLTKLSANGRRFVWLERRVSPEVARQVNAQDISGLIEVNEPQRLYQYDHIGGQLIGFTDIDNKGLSGIELQEDALLTGTDGSMIMQRNGLGDLRPSVDFPRVEPVNGADLVLTVDIEYQAIAEEELRKGVERNKAQSGLAVMMDPRTGEILALANYPSLDPTNSSRTDPSEHRNRAITDMFEPGSVFKVVTASAALERRVVKPEQKFDAERGKYTIPQAGGKTRVITDMHEFSTLTFQEAMEQSSNIVMAKISDRIGAEGLYTTARNFGFGTPTGVELPGEISGELKKPSEWSGATLNSMAFGYEVGVTPLQLVTAYCAVANGGMLMKPFVVQRATDPSGNVTRESRPEPVRRVISKETAETVKQMLEGVVQRGTGVSARLNGVAVAGKTGTSRKFIGGKYETGSYTATFIGFLPSDDPRVVCLVMLDSPSAGVYTGGLASAPIFRAIAERVYTTSRRFARSNEVIASADGMRTVPDVTNLKSDDAHAILKEQGFGVKVEGEGTVVLAQWPQAGTKVERGTRITMVMDQAGALLQQGMVVVPEVRRLPIRRAINRLATRQLEAVVTGSGIVTAQSPQPGEHVRVGTRVTVRCQPPSLAGTVMY